MDYAWQSAFTHLMKEGQFEEGLKLLGNLTPSNKQERLEILLSIGMIYEKQHMWEKLQTTADEALSIANELSFPEQILRARVLKCYDFFGRMKLKEGLTFAEESISFASDMSLENSEYAELLYLLGIFHYYNRNFVSSHQYFDKSNAIRQNLGDLQSIAHIQNAKAIVYEKMGDLKNARKLYLSALGLKEKHGDITELARAYYNLGAFFYSIGEYELSDKYSQKSLPLFEKLNSNFLGDAIFLSSQLQFEKGNYLESLSLLTKSFTYISKTHDPLKYFNALMLQCSLHHKLKKGMSEIKTEINQMLQNHPHNPELQMQGLLFQAISRIYATRLSEKFSAIEFLDEIISLQSIHSESYVEALLLKCSLVSEEMEFTSELPAIEELAGLALKVKEYGEQNNSPYHIVKGLFFLSKSYFYSNQIETGIKTYQTAFSLAVEKGMGRLAKEIAYGFDKDMKRVNFSKNSSFQKIFFEISNFETSEEPSPPSKLHEAPLMFVIINEAGIAKYSKTFHQGISINTNLVASFISAMQLFLKEAFNNNENMRYIWNESYGLVFDSFSTIYLCYVFKGNSYYPLKKILSLKDKILTSFVSKELNGRKSLSTLSKTVIDEIVTEVILNHFEPTL